MSRFGFAHLIRLAPASAALTTASGVTSAATSLAIPTVAARAIDEMLRGRRVGSTLAVLMGLLALRVLAEASSEVAQSQAATRVIASLSRRVLRHVFALGVPGLRRHSSGDLVTRLTANVAMAGKGVPVLVNAVVATAASLGGLVALWLTDWWLVLVFAAGVIPAMYLLRRLVNQVTTAYSEYLEHLAAIAARLADALAGSRTIRASGTIQREVGRILAPLPDLGKSGMRAWDVQRAASWQVGLVLTATRMATILVAGLSLAQQRISPGEFVASSLYLGIALGFVSQVDNLLRVGDASANAGRALELLDESPRSHAVLHTDRDHLPPGPGAISFRDVSVRHGDRIVLDHVDLDIPGGAAVAVVGRSGAGKTTLAQLVGSLLDPDEGKVLIDGAAVDRVSRESLHREVAYAFDRPVLLGSTVLETLTYGRPDTADVEVERAMRIAQAEDFVKRLPEGLRTALEHSPFSGGELQRLGLARAIAHGGRIFVLDDATSSLDTVTEAKLADALTTGLAGRTRLVIAHRARTAAKADLVVWLDGGRVRSVAPHSALWATEADYRAVFAAGPLRDEDAA